MLLTNQAYFYSAFTNMGPFICSGDMDIERGKQRSSLHIHHWILMMFLTQHDRDTESVDRDLVFYLHKQRSCLKCRLTAKMVLNIVTLLWYSRSVPLD